MARLNSPRARIALKLAWAAAMILTLVVFSSTEYDFVYRVF